MPWSLIDARFALNRATGLMRRGLISLRTRGLKASWERTLAQFQRLAAPPNSALYMPSTAGQPSIAGSSTPVASIVIPVYNQLRHTLRCLQALSEHPPLAAFEVIVVDDGSSDGTREAMQAIPGLRYIQRKQNGGFVDACNDGASHARGDVLVFLNNDTIPQPGWLDALLRTLSEEPDAGIAGAQLRYPDGRLQEAGGLVFNDGSAWNYGRGGSPDDCRYAYLRDTDYISGAAIAISRPLFDAIGGFEADYSPAYYEDTDLAFKVRAAGKRVYYQPASVVLHEEGATAGTDPDKGIKAYQARNRTRFANRHRDALQRHPDPASLPSPASIHARTRQILVIDALTPTPDHDSGSLRLVNLMRMLREEGAHVVFVPADLAHAGAYTRSLQHQGVEVWHAPQARRLTSWLREHGRRFDVVMVCRHYVARGILPLLRRHAAQARLVFDTVDLHYLREQRGAEVASDNGLAKVAARTRALELGVMERSDITLVVSPVERDMLAQDAPTIRVEVLSNLHHLTESGKSFAERRDMVFVGGFRHPPNVDAVQWFVREVFPRVRVALPEVRFHCIGGHVPPAVASLASQPGVIVHGHVPDIAPYMDGCRIALAPLRYGAGVKGKVNLSMAHGQPVVATPGAVEGMHLRHEHDVLVAEDAVQFAAQVVRLYRDENLWRRLSDNGRENVSAHFSLQAARSAVRSVFFEGPHHAA